MKILLLRPPLMQQDDNAITKIKILQPPIGISSIAAFLKSKGCSVNIIDMYNFDWDDVLSVLKNSDADIFGISCLTGQHFSAFRLAGMIKQVKYVRPCFVAIGGPHVNLLDREILVNISAIDFVIREEGELTFLELVQALTKGGELASIKGLTYRDKSSRVIRNELRDAIKDLDSLPFPDYSFFDFDSNISFNDGHIDVEKRRNNEHRLQYAPIVTSRGCVNKCLFCAIYMFTPVRFRSVDNVIAEIEKLYRTRGIDHFSFVDDSFCISLKRVEDLCDEIKKRNLKITFSAAARVKPMSETMLIKMKKAGCIGLSFGLESGSRKILDNIKKEITPEEIINAFAMTKKVGIKSTALLMVGNPGEDKSTINDTKRILKICKPDNIVISPLVILPNSGIYDYALKAKLITPDYWFKDYRLPYYTAEYTPDELRYFRIKLLLFFHIIRRQYKKAIKTAMVKMAYFIIIKSGLEINRVRDFLLNRGLSKRFLNHFAA